MKNIYYSLGDIVNGSTTTIPNLEYKDNVVIYTLPITTTTHLKSRSAHLFHLI